MYAASCSYPSIFSLSLSYIATYFFFFPKVTGKEIQSIQQVNVFFLRKPGPSVVKGKTCPWNNICNKLNQKLNYIFYYLRNQNADNAVKSLCKLFKIY